MWMLYAEQHWTKAIDLKSAVERLYEKIGALVFDADHEAIYGMEKYYAVEQCEKLRDKYKIGRKVCRQFLKGKTCSQCLVKRISDIGLHFLDTISKYIHNQTHPTRKIVKKQWNKMVKIQRQRKKKNQRKVKVEEIQNLFHSLKTDVEIVSTKFDSIFSKDHCRVLSDKYSKESDVHMLIYVAVGLNMQQKSKQYPRKLSLLTETVPMGKAVNKCKSLVRYQAGWNQVLTEFSLPLCDPNMEKRSIITRIDLHNVIMELPHVSNECRRTQVLQFLMEHFGTNGDENATKNLVQFTRESFFAHYYRNGKSVDRKNGRLMAKFDFCLRKEIN
ncbi:hypothetical protein FQA39_LY02785 [Lamprigera yunnana]|nr:hypothetical protein FQA39_LY02785 [Lamprigera yunnana]